MDIKVVERRAPSLDALLGPEDKVIMRCLKCQSFFIPREIRTVTARWRDQGHVVAHAWMLCPVCYPEIDSNIDTMRLDQFPESEFLTLSRDEYEITRSYERAGLIPPQKRSGLLVS
jgi:hypothetical protein